MKFYSVVLAFLSLLIVQSQPKPAEPLIELYGKKYVLIDRGITGFMFSIDGQWISAPMKIPARLNSRDEAGFKTKENALGTDNISALYMHRIKYGNKILYVFYKVYKEGYYKYSATKKGWKEESVAYYFVIDDDALKTILEAPAEDVMLKLKLYDSGTLRKVRISNLQSKALLQIRIRQEYDRQMIFHIDKSYGDGEARFFFYSQHKIFKDTEGVLRPEFKISGKSYFAQPSLMKFFYYKIQYDVLEDFLKLKNPKFKDDEPETDLTYNNAGQD